ncbi:MAG: preprotein translocase subunit SecA [Patescibacteria group bacterium]|nr:preprotein translocase subunit SecA [Patescibacteria group bacterium]
MKFIEKLFGGAQNKQLSRMQVVVEKINELEPQIQKLTDEELKEKTKQFKKQLEEKRGKEAKKELDEILPEAFAVVREGAHRVIGERAYDTQLIGAMVLHHGKIAEMKTGEGKTLAAVLAVYLNALTGNGVHVITVNDYLSKRDANWMGSIYHFLGLSTACLNHDVSYLYQPKVVDSNEVSVEMENLKAITRTEAYKADVLYGTNNEFGFDYLRDNMAQDLAHLVQRPLNFAIVDEVDSILIDEARTPLIISAPDTESTRMYQQFARLVPRLNENGDYNVDEKLKSVVLTAEGISKMEKWLGIGNIYETSKVTYVHHLEQALKAHVLFTRDRDYVIKEGEVIIVDEFTGRMMAGRRYSEGLHQAIEAKENVKVQRESRTLATITFQNYFRMYEKLSGMTGTALTSAEELFRVYELEVTEIPTNKSLARNDMRDVVYKSEKGKFSAIIDEIMRLHNEGRPVLVGTIAIEKSEYLSAVLEKRGIDHEVLNAKNHEREAQIISKAGQKGAVTIATNMAGRGTDIKLGDGVREVGGLHILGTERHEARRIDNQLRGRAGRQGDPGSSQFFVSLEDELMRRFGGDRMGGIMNKLGLPEDQPIENKMVSRSIESAQGKIEGFNFDMRKRILEYDDVMNKQRETIYKKRKEALGKESVKEDIRAMLVDEVESIVGAHTALDDEDEWNVEEISEEVETLCGEGSSDVHKKLIEMKRSKDFSQSAEKKSAMIDLLVGQVKKIYGEKEKELGSEQLRAVEKSLMLRTTDSFWMDHLEQIERVREGIGFQGYGQRDPLIMYKKEAFNLFQGLLANINRTIINALFKIQLVPAREASARTRVPENVSYSGGEEAGQFEGGSEVSDGGAEASAVERKEAAPTAPIVNDGKSVGRNDPCPCGSGKKYKKCHGKN